MNFSFIDHWDSKQENWFSIQSLGFTKLSVGQEIRVGVPNGSWGTVKVIDILGSKALLSGAVKSPSLPPHPMTVGIGISRPKMLKRIIRSVVEVGVKEIHLFKSFLCEKSYMNSNLIEESELIKVAKKSLQQVSADTHLPRFHIHKHFKPFIEDIWLSSIPAQSIICADSRGVQWHPISTPPPKAILFGPEKGFSEKEIHLLKSLNIKVYKFGERIMRQETALPVILGSISPI